jgi:catechol 1,2-dioxygenase/hydroxyquinol 1,2-dioxygenase
MATPTIRKIDENTITDAAIEQMSTTTDPRMRFVMEKLVGHLHDFAREVDLTPEEWIKGITFLTAVGQKCTPTRQEFILLSDTLGLSSLVNSLHDKRSKSDGTKSSLLGPFYRQDSPDKKLGDIIAADPRGQVVTLYGRVTDEGGKAIPNASVEIWQPNEDGDYDLQLAADRIDLRGHFHADSDGRYYARSVAPNGYLIPMDGPVGDMIRAQKRHGFRPAHIHFLVGAPGYREAVTALYLGNDDHIDSDTVFGVTSSLVTEVKQNDPKSPIPGLPSIEFNFVLGRADDLGTGRVGADPSQIVKK